MGPRTSHLEFYSNSLQNPDFLLSESGCSENFGINLEGWNKAEGTFIRCFVRWQRTVLNTGLRPLILSGTIG